MSVRITAEGVSGGGQFHDHPGWFEIHLTGVRELGPEQSSLTIELPEEVARQLAQLIQKSLPDVEGQ